MLLGVLFLVLAAEFVNGWTDAPNSIATVVSTRVLSPGKALLMASILNALGALSGTAVAATIGKGIVDPSVINIYTVGAAMVGIVFWSTLAWYYGMPTSESHALIAGLTGAALATAGPKALILAGWEKVGTGLLFSTFLGFGGGLALIETGDRVRLDLNAGRLDLLISDADLAARRAAWSPPVLSNQTPWQQLYRENVGQLEGGGCLEFATAYHKAADVLPRDNH